MLFALLFWLITYFGRDPLDGFPRVVLWAWERPEDLRFLSPDRAGVAYLAATVRVYGDQFGVRPRMQPLRVQPHTPLIAVVRIETPQAVRPAWETLDDIAKAIVSAAGLSEVRALQIDFDARESEREWYRELLRRLRKQMPARVPLTITALVSWCGQDAWMDGLPVADASPMMFRMGKGEYAPVRDFERPLCRSSVGLSTDEWPARVPRGRRLYIFHPRSWMARDYEGAISMARRWQ